MCALHVCRALVCWRCYNKSDLTEIDLGPKKTKEITHLAASVNLQQEYQGDLNRHGGMSVGERARHILFVCLFVYENVCLVR